MNWNQMEGQWKQMKGKAKQQWGKLTDDDLTFINGKRDSLVGRLQERYGYAQEEAQRRAEDWMKTMRDEPEYAHSSSTSRPETSHGTKR